MKTSSKYLLLFIPILISAFLIWFFKDIVTYVVIAWVLSMVGAPIMRFCERFLPKGLSAVATLLVFTLVLFLIVGLFLPPIVQQARNLAGIDYEKLTQSLEEPIDDWNQWLINKGFLPSEEEASLVEDKQEEDGDVLQEFAVVKLDSIYKDSTQTNVNLLININNPKFNNELEEEDNKKPEAFLDKVRNNVFSLLNPARIPELFGSVFGFMSNIFITLLSVYFIAFFFLKERGLFESILRSIVSTKYEDQAIHALDESSVMLVRYFVGVALQITIITIFVATALTLFGIKNALLIGFFAALINVIPYLGPIIGAVFGVIITISSSLEQGDQISGVVNSATESAAALAANPSFYADTLPQILIVIGVFGVMQLLDNFFIQPNIFSKSVKAHPLEIFVVVLAGAQIGGITGMVLAIPAYTVLRVLASIFLSEFKIVQSITKDLSIEKEDSTGNKKDRRES